MYTVVISMYSIHVHILYTLIYFVIYTNSIYLSILYKPILYTPYIPRLKELLKLYGSPDTKLKRRKTTDSESPNGTPKIEKTDYITTLLDVLRLSDDFGNDYKMMAQFLMNDSNTTKGKKGFGAGKK